MFRCFIEDTRKIPLSPEYLNTRIPEHPEELLMPRHNQMIVLDCPYTAWRAQTLTEIHSRQDGEDYLEAQILPFTFSDVPFALVGGERDVVLRPAGGVKS